MTFNKLKGNNQGFTIIEVLIVLAIAGMIMLVVFLAVPALQRNSRNTQRSSDISALMGSIQEHSTNNSGQLPTTAAMVTANAKLGFYDPATDVTVAAGAMSRTAALTAAVTSNGSAVIFNNFSKCGTQPGGNVADHPLAATGATKRNVTVVYQIETAGGFQAKCLDM